MHTVSGSQLVCHVTHVNHSNKLQCYHYQWTPLMHHFREICQFRLHELEFFFPVSLSSQNSHENPTGVLSAAKAFARATNKQFPGENV
jgi:hypothetical protein